MKCSPLITESSSWKPPFLSLSFSALFIMLPAQHSFLPWEEVEHTHLCQHSGPCLPSFMGVVSMVWAYFDAKKSEMFEHSRPSTHRGIPFSIQKRRKDYCGYRGPSFGVDIVAHYIYFLSYVISLWGTPTIESQDLFALSLFSHKPSQSRAYTFWHLFIIPRFFKYRITPHQLRRLASSVYVIIRRICWARKLSSPPAPLQMPKE